MNRFSRGMSIAKQSLDTLTKNKRFLLYPILSAIVSLAIIITVGITFFDAVSAHYNSPTTTQSPHSIATYFMLFVFYVVLYSVTIFFNTALAASIIAYFRGQRISFTESLGVAIDRIGKIVLWGIISATVGVILHAIEQRAHRSIVAILRAVIGASWMLLTYFVIPVMVVENVGPITAIKRSLNIVKKQWGESATLVIGLGVIVIIGFLIAVSPITLVFIFNPDATAIFICAGLSAVLFLLLMLFSATLSMVVRCALYYYSTQGKVPMSFNEQVLNQAFKVKG